MDGLAERIAAARERVQEMHSERAKDLASIAALEAELRDGRREAEVLKARIIELEQEVEVLRAVKPTPEVEGRAGTKEKIDELVNEIDQCLALLTP